MAATVSRSLSALVPYLADVARRLVLALDAQGVDLLIYCTHRTPEEQARLWRQGRSIEQIEQGAAELRDKLARPDLAEILLDVGPQAGLRPVTYAMPGQSLHQYGLAFDAVTIRDGKPVWGTSLREDVRAWTVYGKAAQEQGLLWAGSWKRFKEYPHCQLPGYRWQQLIRGAHSEDIQTS